MVAILDALAGFLDGIIWSQTLMYLLLIAGLYLSCRTRFLQIRLLGPMIRLLFNSGKSEAGITSFQAFCTALAGRVGTGNIVGTSSAIVFGGPGAIFWMWLLAFLGAATSFVECTLAQVYKIKVDEQYRSGPAYFIERGLGRKGYATIFAIVTIISVGILLPGIQSQAIAEAFYTSLGVNKMITGAVVAVILALIIFGGIKRIGNVAQIIVPFMVVVYVLLSLVIICIHIGDLGHVLGLIFGSAFGANSIFGGILGSAIAWGIKRGIYSNEAGQGSQPHAAGASEVSHPAKQGLVQAFGIYIDTLLVCSATAFMILLTDCYNVIGADGTFLHQGIEAVASTTTGSVLYTQQAVATLLGAAGPITVSICLAFFAFTTIMNYYYQAECNIAYLFKNAQSESRSAVTLYLRLAMVAIVFGASIMTNASVWNLGDLGVGSTAWLNIVAILLLQKPAVDCLRDYERQHRAGYDPYFDPDVLGIENADLWHEIVDEKYPELKAAQQNAKL